MSESKAFIGLVGEKRGGKETFTNLLREALPDKKIERVRFSDVLFETLHLWGIYATRGHLQKLAVVMNDGFGEGTLTKAVYKRIIKTEADISVVDGVRWETDVRLIRKLPRNLLVYITADPRTRYSRQLKISEKHGEKDASFEQFMAEEQARTELLIPEIGQGADFTIKNNGTLEEFRGKVQDFCQKYLV